MPSELPFFLFSDSPKMEKHIKGEGKEREEKGRERNWKRWSEMNADGHGEG